MAPTLGANSRSSQDLANDPFIFEDSSDNGYESPCADANIRKASTKKRGKPKKSKLGRSRPNPAATKVTSNRNKIVKAIEAAASLLTNIGNEEDVADWLDDNDFNNEEELQNLRRACGAISTLLRVKASPINAEGDALAKELDQYYVFRSSYNSAMLLAPIESFRFNSSYTTRKVIGLVRRRGEMFPLMMALPGWKPCADAHPKLLDSALWCDYVLQFASHVDHRFRTDGFDRFHNKEEGASFASHVEPKLLLFFACHLLTKRMGEKFNLRRLWRLQKLKTRIEAEIIISEAPCPSCKKFKELIELFTGLKFTFKVCKNLGTLKPFRNSSGRKMYSQFASAEEEFPENAEVEEEDEQEGEEDHRFPLQTRSPNVTVVIKSNMGLSSKNTTRVKISQTQVNSFKQHRLSSVTKTTQPRQKRQYEESDDNEDYTEPRRRPHIPDVRGNTPAPQTRSSKRTPAGLMSPTPSPSSHYNCNNERYDEMERGPAESTPSYSWGVYGGKRVRWS